MGPLWLGVNGDEHPGRSQYLRSLCLGSRERNGSDQFLSRRMASVKRSILSVSPTSLRGL